MDDKDHKKRYLEYGVTLQEAARWLSALAATGLNAAEAMANLARICEKLQDMEEDDGGSADKNVG